MAKITPYRHDDRWCVDLRSVRGDGKGRHTRLDVAADAPRGEAVEAAIELLASLVRRGSPPKAPDSRLVTLPGTAPGRLGLDGQCLFRFACDHFGARKEYSTVDGKLYGDRVLKQVRGELGAVRIGEFEPPAGFDILLGYRNRLVEAGQSPRTRANRLNVVRQVLQFCCEWGWLSALPKFPKATLPGEVLYVPEYRWITEEQFRDVRGELFRRQRRGDEGEARAAQRRLYLSTAFYTGMHNRDVDEVVTETFRVSEFGSFFERTNTKSARAVPQTRLEAPEQLALDVREEEERLGRAFLPGEAIAGGPWPKVARILNETAARLGLPELNMRVFRRSTARMLCMLGWSERDCAEYLGHVDTQMIRKVYARVDVNDRSPIKVAWTVENSKFPWLAMRRPKKVLSFAEALDRAKAGGSDDNNQ